MPRLALLLLLAAAGCAPGDALRLDAEADRPAVRTVHLAGRFVTSYRARPARGVAGLRVYLLFRRADGDGWDAARPPSGAARRHRTFDVLGEDGAFRFDLATADDLSAYDEVAVVPALESDAVRIVPRPAGARVLDDTTTVLPPADAIRVPLPAAGAVRATGLEGEVRTAIGVTVRTATLARAFVHARYDGAPPFALPPVRVELSGGGGFVFQTVDPDALGLGGHEIELNASRGVTPTVVAHEYGHYVTFRMWGASPFRYALRHRALREGWAIFFSFATRAWVAERYGDVDLASSNPERAAFTDRFDRPRYDGIAYGASRPTYAAIGALLWSLYDGAEPSPFEFSGEGLATLAGDNDDVSGHARDVFEAVRTTRALVRREAGIAEVVATFKGRVPPALGPSVDGAVGFFLCPAVEGCDVRAAVGDGATTGSATLRPPAPGALVARRLPDGRVALAWDPRVPPVPWANPPAAVRILRDGVPVATLPGTASAWVDAGAGPGAALYTVRAEGGGGVAYGAAVARAAPVGGDGRPRRRPR